MADQFADLFPEASDGRVEIADAVEHVERQVYRCSKGHAWEESLTAVGGGRLVFGNPVPAHVIRVTGLGEIDGDYCMRCWLGLLGKVERVE